ncbi:Goodbye domain containing protein [Pyrenophora tritici-repentis]|nr:Goodbye domain containing protein [Pyrenophora tritici-repentis]
MSRASPNIASAFERALEEFKKSAGLKQHEITNFQLTSLDDLRCKISDIQNEQRKTKKLVYLKRLGPFLETMEQYGTIIEVFLNISDFVAFIWGPMKFLLLTARNYTDAFNSLLDMYLEIGESMPQFAQYQTLFQNNTHMQLALVNIYKDILEFHKEALQYFRQKKWQELFHATWRPFSKTVAQLNKDMHRHKKLIENQISIAGYEAMQSSHSESMMHFEELK